MNSPRPCVYNLANRRAIHFPVFAVMLSMIVVRSLDAGAAALVPDRVSSGGSIASFDDTAQVSADFEDWTPRRLRARRDSASDQERSFPRETSAVPPLPVNSAHKPTRSPE